MSSPKVVQFSIDRPEVNAAESLTISTLEDGVQESPVVVSYSSRSTKEHQSPMLAHQSATHNEVPLLLERISELELQNKHYESTIDDMKLQIEQFAVLRKQSSIGFKSQRNIAEAQALSAKSGKSITLSMKVSGPSLISSKSVSSLGSYSPLHSVDEKNEKIKALEAEIARHLQSIESLNQSLFNGVCAAPISDAAESLEPSETEKLRRELQLAKQKIIEMEIQNTELRMQAEQFSTLRAQSSASFKYIRAQSSKYLSVKSPRIVPTTAAVEEIES